MGSIESDGPKLEPTEGVWVSDELRADFTFEGNLGMFGIEADSGTLIVGLPEEVRAVEIALPDVTVGVHFEHQEVRFGLTPDSEAGVQEIEMPARVSILPTDESTPQAFELTLSQRFEKGLNRLLPKTEKHIFSVILKTSR